MIEFFVAPGGDDSGPGTRERPFATPGRAREAARAAAAATCSCSSAAAPTPSTSRWN
ncbi:hypothetical protein [Nonomuraea sp. NPDC050691]|uniref:hypothetical protein n=1 Tax=Nonomuraea sp. NPDC050691 TaxID=3155661 RepID=UPI0033E95B1C